MKRSFLIFDGKWKMGRNWGEAGVLQWNEKRKEIAVENGMKACNKWK